MKFKVPCYIIHEMEIMKLELTDFIPRYFIFKRLEIFNVKNLWNAY